MLGAVSGALFASIDPDPISIITKSWEKAQDNILLGHSQDPDFIPNTLQSNIYPFTDDGVIPDPFIKSAGIGPNSIPWQDQGDGISYLRLPFASKKEAQGLYKMAPGTIVETHNHDTLELVLVFQGAIRDDRSEYWPGDLMITPPNYSHELEVIGNDECMYLLMFDDEGEIEIP